MCKAAASSPAQIREFQYKKGKVGEEEEETLPALCVGIGDKDEEEGGDLEQREFLPPDTAGGERMGMRGRGGLDRGAGGGMIAVKEQGDAKAEGEEEDVAACGCGHEHAACAAGDVGLVVSALRGALGCRRNGGCRAGGGGWWRWWFGRRCGAEASEYAEELFGDGGGEGEQGEAEQRVGEIEERCEVEDGVGEEVACEREEEEGGDEVAEAAELCASTPACEACGEVGRGG